jgi:hypothetical protein
MTARPLANRFLDSLRELGQGRRRLTLEECWAALYEADPLLIPSADKRRVLAEILGTLAQEGSIQLCAASNYDRTEQPPVPRFVTLPTKSSPQRAYPLAATFPWRPALSWAADLDLNMDEFELLQVVNAFLRDGGEQRRVVPAQERSLELFCHEKTLDRLSRGRLFGEGRLSFELLRARRVPPPFPWQQVGAEPTLLVAENSATFATLQQTLPLDSPIGFVVYGGGTSFITAVESTHDLMTTAGLKEPIRHIFYFGDLDQRGIAIPIAASVAAEQCGLPPVRPAVSLYKLLLQYGKVESVPALNSEVAEDLVSWFLPDLQSSILAHLVSGHRLAQEAIGTDLLSGEEKWATHAALSGT